MNLAKFSGKMVLAFAFVAFAAVRASAQAPTLTVTVNAPSVAINWTPVPGALGYTLQAGTAAGLSNIASVNLPASITRIAVVAPPGVYYLRVRAFSGTVAGPFSNEAVANMFGPAPPPSCQPPAAPSVTANVQGGNVTLNWPSVAGAIGYQVQWSRFSGGTELVENSSTNSHSKYVGVPGTFYARVVALTSCGNATSAEVPFTIVTLTGSGPRTPNPAPGQMLPLPSYGQNVVIQMAQQYRGDLLNSCRDTGGNNTFVFRVVQALRQRDTRWGLNYKRGQKGELSQDIVAYNGTANPDEGESHVYLIDIISGHCGSNPDWNWGDVSAVTWANRGQSYCGTEWCAYWTLDPYIRAGFPPDPR
jgi:hypothetical protein